MSLPGTYILRRLLIALPSLLGISLVLFTVLALAPGEAWLKMRLPAVQIPRVLFLADQTLALQGHRLHVGLPLVEPIVAHPTLESPLVVIKGFMDEEPFGLAVHRQLTAMGLRATPIVTRRRVINIGGHRVVGFGVRLEGLAPTESLRVQAVGVGGRQRMGCGIFVPPR